MMHETSSHSLWRRGHRFAGFLWLAIFLFWLPFEDTEVVGPLLLAIWASIWIAIVLASRLVGSKNLWRPALLGLLAGMVMPILTALFMVFKTGIHAHGFSEYGANQILFVFSVFPFSIVLGLVFGLLYLRSFARFEKTGGDSP